MNVTYCYCKCSAEIPITSYEKCKHDKCKSYSIKAILAEVG